MPLKQWIRIPVPCVYKYFKISLESLFSIYWILQSVDLSYALINLYCYCLYNTL